MQNSRTLWYKFDSKLNPHLRLPRRPDKRGRDEVATIDLKQLLRNIEKNRCGGGHFEFNEPKTSSSTDQNKNAAEKVSNTEESEVVKRSVNFPIVNLKNYDIAEKNDTLFLGQPRHRKTKDYEHPTGRKNEENTVRLNIWLEKFFTQNIVCSEVATTKDMCDKHTERKNPRKVFSGYR